ncbi:hypothetical protein [Burkholderia stagnalis]|uniref:hypothetical protein n=1 Tax=Burkholderia stagnalis TaxID=1503054 RepID=UPI000F60114B|nr:hypothetical protein [Burkholderia stagnalis]RQX94952.1 hypothetical protein DF119_22445 [Burkholderia stagnalis]RQY32504.1 hypothetical protein DF116_26700 [Burkholderia stagnalis]RQY56625.1 hypothetical protein DF111_12520 [Burkholderia stagnalis]RQY86399.1 hypothetical protein DF108_12335 [Burkholderia stagnalis]
MDQHEFYTANTVDDGATASAGSRQLPALTAASPNDEHRVIADDWLRRAVDGIRVMHLDDDERRRVAREAFLTHQAQM